MASARSVYSPVIASPMADNVNLPYLDVESVASGDKPSSCRSKRGPTGQKVNSMLQSLAHVQANHDQTMRIQYVMAQISSDQELLNSVRVVVRKHVEKKEQEQKAEVLRRGIKRLKDIPQHWLVQALTFMTKLEPGYFSNLNFEEQQCLFYCGTKAPPEFVVPSRATETDSFVKWCSQRYDMLQKSLRLLDIELYYIDRETQTGVGAFFPHPRRGHRQLHREAHCEPQHL